MLEDISPGIVFKAEPVKKEIRQFVTEDNAYYCVTMKGEVYYIVSLEVLSEDAEDKEDFFSYMWVKTTNGYFIFSQRFHKLIALDWVVDVEIIPETDECRFFYDMRDYLREPSTNLRELCGEPLEQELPNLSKTWTLGIQSKKYHDLGGFNG
ncbi:MAG: hypothetical protein LWY06_01560 [Firmicutes bacterium]|nr:hypothetical protein [Bacillota bacterium]